jgi:hypothetical protein
MVIAPLTLRSDYWDTFNLQNQDLDFLYNHLIEIETPQTSEELTAALVEERIRNEKEALQNRSLADGTVFAPKDTYNPGQTLVFPALDWKKGKVINSRPGNNPQAGPFDVIEVHLETGENKYFATHLENHRLNQPIEVRVDDPLLDKNLVMSEIGPRLVKELEQSIETNPDLVRIAGRWFPRALLVDVNIGHLNLAEAVLDIAGGGPMTTKAILDQVELPTDVNLKLTEFSLNLSLQEDGRFDEVGPAGEVLWFLQRLEPDGVKQPPLQLKYHNIAYDRTVLTPDMLALESDLDDELSPQEGTAPRLSEVVIKLTYPHWRAGTLPLSDRLKRLFPTAYETPRIRFTLVVGEDQMKIPGWVVRPNRYVYGLRDWYTNQGILPGSMIHVRQGKNAGEVIVQAEKHRPTREWIRTVLVGADGGIVFAMLKQVVNASFDDRMVIAVPDVDALDRAWEQTNKQRMSFENIVVSVMRELAKLNTQGHVHAQELYSAVNINRRCPPGPVFGLLASRPWFDHVGDLHFRLDESAQQGDGS